jgi:PAS domain S-box-containing protein
MPRRSHGSEITVVVIDDEESFLELTRTYLEQRDDLSIRTTTDREDVLEAVESGSVDCVVSDYDMPGTDGLELLDAVRAVDPTLPFVLFTGRGSEEVASEAISAGVSDYLQKGGSSEVYGLLANRIRNAVAETRARGRAERYETIVEALDYPAYVVDERGEFQFVNESFTDLTGYEIEEVIGAEPGLIKSPAGVELAASTLGEVLSADHSDTAQFDIDILTADGEAVPCRDHMAALPYEGEEFVGSVGILRNIADERERLRELHRFQRMVETAGEAICALDQDGLVTYANAAFLDLLGVEESAVLGSRYVDQLRWETDEPDPVTHLLGRTPPATRTFEAPVADADRSVETTLSLSEGPEGAVVTAVVRDAGSSDDSLEVDIGSHALEEASIGITLTGPARDGCPILFVNDAFCEITGYERSTVLGRSHDFLQGPATGEAGKRSLRDGIDAGESTSSELVNYRCDGSPFWNRVEIEPIRDDDGMVTHFIGFQRDVTDERLAVREASRHEERIERLTSDLTHDIKTPLSVAQGHLDLLAEDADVDAETIETIDGALDRSLELLAEFRTLVETGASVHDPEQVDLAAVARTAWDAAAGDSATLTVEDGLDSIHADSQRLRRLLENLFRNAVDHAGPDVTVTIGPLTEGFFVADDGPGIPEPDRDQVFEPGYSTREDGHGSGLAIVEQIADAHGWEISVTEAAAGGARFELTGIRLPRHLPVEN